MKKSKEMFDKMMNCPQTAEHLEALNKEIKEALPEVLNEFPPEQREKIRKLQEVEAYIRNLKLPAVLFINPFGNRANPKEGYTPIANFYGDLDIFNANPIESQEARKQYWHVISTIGPVVLQFLSMANPYIKISVTSKDEFTPFEEWENGVNILKK